MRVAVLARPAGLSFATVLMVTLGGAAAYAQASSAGGMPRLTGIVIAGQQRVAIFENPPGLTTAIGEGERIAAYVVRSIRPDGVQVESEGRSFALTLSQSDQTAAPIDTGVTFGKVVNPRRPPDD